MALHDDCEDGRGDVALHVRQATHGGPTPVDFCHIGHPGKVSRLMVPHGAVWIGDRVAMGKQLVVVSGHRMGTARMGTAWALGGAGPGARGNKHGGDGQRASAVRVR